VVELVCCIWLGGRFSVQTRNRKYNYCGALAHIHSLTLNAMDHERQWIWRRIKEIGHVERARARLLGAEDGQDWHDVCIVGAGPAGSTCAFYLAKEAEGIFAGTPLRIAILEKAPSVSGKDKYCGDAWCAPALDILEDMGVLQDLEKEGLVSNTLCGGFVSPAGHSFLANDRNTPMEQKSMSVRCYAIKRKICDERITRKAEEQEGVSVFENALVNKCVLDQNLGVWKIECGNGRVFRCRMLVAADGAASNIARSLGIVEGPPEAVAARRYVKPGTHNFKADGVLLYPNYTLPGYVALFRHFDDSVDLGLYLLPGGVAKDSDLLEIYEKKLLRDPFVARALGPKAEFAERLKVASLRLGGVERSFGDHVLLVGDAAGQVDPLTGEGIHTGMQGGRLAAITIAEMFRKSNFSAQAGEVYHKCWMNSFGCDFPISSVAGKIVNKFPFFMDAVPVTCSSKGVKAGSDFFADFGAVMTGVLPKSHFLRPSVAFPLAMATIGQLFSQLISKTERSYFANPALFLNEELKRPTSFDYQCLIDPTVSTDDLQSVEENPQEEVFKFCTDEERPNVLVAYGSEYGFSKDVAFLLSERLSNEAMVNPRCVDLAHFPVIDWKQESAAFLICSTAGDGDPPLAVTPFFESMEEGIVGDLRHMFFSVLAPGDSSYPHFAKAGFDLDEFFDRAQAQRCVPLETLDGDDPALANFWMDSIVSFCLQNESSFRSSLVSVDYLSRTTQEQSDLFEIQKGATAKKPLEAKIKGKRLLTNMEQSGDKETWHIEIDVSHGWELVEYEPGDALGVHPKNNPELVREILAVLSLEHDQSQFEELLTKDLHGSLQDFKKDPGDHVLDILESGRVRFNGIEEFLKALKPLQPRFYSISSSPVRDKGEIHLCVGVVRYEHRGRQREGVATTFLVDRVKTDEDFVSIWIQRNIAFRPHRNSVMIGPGTGIAPFRSFIRHVQPNFDHAFLFFGCRRHDEDFLYSEELLKWETNAPQHELEVAFSRAQPEKLYVQHLLLNRGADVAEFLHNTDAKIYICGEGSHMAKNVKDTLKQILRTHLPNHLESEQALTQFLKTRLHLDVWNV